MRQPDDSPNCDPAASPDRPDAGRVGMSLEDSEAYALDLAIRMRDWPTIRAALECPLCLHVPRCASTLKSEESAAPINPS